MACVFNAVATEPADEGDITPVVNGRPISRIELLMLSFSPALVAPLNSLSNFIRLRRMRSGFTVSSLAGEERPDASTRPRMTTESTDRVGMTSKIIKSLHFATRPGKKSI